MKREEEEGGEAGEVREPGGQEEKDIIATQVPTDIGSPTAFLPKNLSTAIVGVNIPSSILRSIVPPPILPDVECFSDTGANTPTTATHSPTLSISTVSDLTPTELGEEIDRSGEQTTIHHESFYLEDGNVEIVCGDTIFRVHSPVVSFSSPNLRAMLSSSTLNAPTLEGCPRIVFMDSAEDFAVLLKMIYTPGYVPPLNTGSVN